jgi:hypothetical protein
MSFNPFVIKKWGALLLVGFLSILGYAIGALQYKNHLIAIAIGMGCLLLGALCGNMLLNNPFRRMVEGKGIMIIDINSTGIIRPFIVQVLPPYIRGKVGKEEVNAIFNRKTVMSMKAPEVLKTKAQLTPEGGIDIKLNENGYNSGRFGLFHYPVLIYNSQIKSTVTKDFLSDQEKDIFAEHTVLYLNHKIEDLTTYVREFGRHVVDQMKPKSSIMGRWGWVIWVVVIILIVMIAAMFAPAVWDIIVGGGGTAASSVGQTLKGAVTPIN